MQYTYSSIWDADKLQGCLCDPGFAGYDCSLRECPSGDDPLTTGQANAVQLLQCLATAGSFALYFRGVPSIQIAFTASAQSLAAALEAHPLISAVNVTFAPGHDTVCSSTNNVARIEFTQDFGALPPLVPAPDKAMLDAGGSVVISADGVTPLIDSAGNVYVSVVGTKESAPCSNRGLCDASTGLCACFTSLGDVYDSSDGYGGPGRRGDCGWVRSSTAGVVSSCPGEVQCSGHGTCNATQLSAAGTGSYTCSCAAGWGAGDCSERVCPLGLAWFAYPSGDEAAHTQRTECSSMGLCDRADGHCLCREVKSL